MSVFFLNTDATDVEQKGDVQQTDEQSQSQSEAQAALLQFWPKVMEEIKSIRNMDLKQQVLPLARIKKIMKLDEDVKMISAKRLYYLPRLQRYLSMNSRCDHGSTPRIIRGEHCRNDIAMAITKFDQFDFLIDIVPRDDIKPNKPKEDSQGRTVVNSDQVQYYFQLAQQHHANLQQNTSQPTASTTPPQSAIQIVQPQQVQAVQVNPIEQSNASSSTTPSSTSQTPVMIQQPSTSPQSQTGGIQIVQQIVTPSGEVQQIPIQLSPQQLQMIRMQLQSNTSQPLIIQAAPIQTTAQPQLIQVQPNSNSQPVFLTQTNGSADTE